MTDLEQAALSFGIALRCFDAAAAWGLDDDKVAARRRELTAQEENLRVKAGQYADSIYKQEPK